MYDRLNRIRFLLLDNVVLNAGSGGSTIASDTIAGIEHQRVKVQYGVDGAATDVSDTNPLPVDDAGGSLTVDAPTGTPVNVQIGDGTDQALVSAGGALQVDVASALPAGTNNIGDVDIASSVALDVSAATVPVDLGANNDVIVQGTDAENAAATAAPVQVGGRYDVTPRVLGDGDVGAVALDADGAVHVSDGGNTLTVDGTVGVSGTVTVDGSGVTQPVSAASLPLPTGAATAAAQLPDGHAVTVDNAAGAAAVNIQDGGNDISVDWAGTAPPIGAGTEAAALRVTLATDSTGVVSVDDGGSTLSVDGTVSVDLNAGTNTNEVVGDVAHDAAAAGNPILAGARATNSIEGLTQVAAADATFVTADLNGVLVTRPHTTLEESISERISNTNGTSTDFTTFAAGGAGIHNYVCDVTITNTSATDAFVDLRDGSAGSIIWTFPAPANAGATHSFSIPLKGAANTALAYDVSAAITTMYISVNGFQAQG